MSLKIVSSKFLKIELHNHDCISETGSIRLLFIVCFNNSRLFISSSISIFMGF